MAIEKITKNYELLVRFNDDGKVGAHLQAITCIFEDGEQIAPPQLGDPKQIDLAELQSIVAALTEADWFVPEVSE